MADAMLAAAINQVIVDIIDREDHHCIAASEGQMCCMDPRPRPDGPYASGYGGEAQPELTERLVALFENWPGRA